MVLASSYMQCRTYQGPRFRLLAIDYFVASEERLNSMLPISFRDDLEIIKRFISRMALDKSNICVQQFVSKQIGLFRVDDLRLI